MNEGTFILIVAISAIGHASGRALCHATLENRKYHNLPTNVDIPEDNFQAPEHVNDILTSNVPSAEIPQLAGNTQNGRSNAWRHPSNHRRAPLPTLWDDGQVRFMIDKRFSDLNYSTILAGMALIEYSASGVEFIQTEDDSGNYAFIRKGAVGSGDSSLVGMVGGKQIVNFESSAWEDEDDALDAVLHELTHLLGREHEHSRENRDDHIVIFWKNLLDKGDRTEYLKEPDGTSNFTYDPYSIMHYDAFAAAKENKAVIQSLVGDRVGSLGKYTNLDIAKLNHLYPEKPDNREILDWDIDDMISDEEERR